MERIAQCLVNGMVAMCTTDLVLVFASVAGQRKAKPNDVPKKSVTALVKLDVFFTEILKLCPNGRVPIKLLIDALVHIDSFSLSGGGDRPYMWNFQPGTTLAAAMRLAATMQKALATLRILKNNPMRYTSHLRGQKTATKAVIYKLMTAMTPLNDDAVQRDQLDNAAINMAIFVKVMAGVLRSHTVPVVAACSPG